MKKVTLFIDDNYSDVITITAIATRGNTTNVNISAHKIKYDDVIHIPTETESETNENNQTVV